MVVRMSPVVILAIAGLLAVLASAGPARAATFRVDDTHDLPDLSPGDGQCRTSAGTCTLRAAIDEANALGGTHAIVLPAGTYKLKIHGALGIRVNLMILGVGATRPVIDGNRITRVFSVHQGATVRIAGVTVQKGKAEGGGGILNQGVLTLDRVLLRDNDAGTGVGGGVLSEPAILPGGFASLTLVNSAVTGNRAASGGGIYNELSTVLVVTGSTIDANKCGSAGGAIRARGDATITNSTISGNRAGLGGGIFAERGVMLTNVTLHGNRADPGNQYGGAGGALAGYGLIALLNTIVADSPSHRNCHGNIQSFGAGRNLDSGATCHLARSLSNVDPKLGSLKLNGGFTKTHALRPGSPAIDAGSNDRCPATDQRGVGRPQDGNGDGTAICDIGAYEASTSP
jgi:predicted outer membrane repeat protein